jgi:hypothetical protein
MNRTEQVTQLFTTLAGQVGMISTREIIAVWAGLKSARIGGSESTVRLIEDAARQLGLASTRSTLKYKGKRDIGKGGWSNKFAGSYSVESKHGDWLLYIAPSDDIAMRAREAEEEDREFDFGGELGIPDCCARFYVQNQEKAMAKQNDYVPFVLRNTQEDAPYDPLLNYVAQYFGFALISFFPCSFNCEHAKSVAQRSYEAVANVAPALAAETMHFQRMPILYTEYRGLYAFGGAHYDGATGRLAYDPLRIHGTLPPTSAVFRYLRQGNCLQVLAKDHVRVLHNDQRIFELEGDNVSACIF